MSDRRMQSSRDDRRRDRDGGDRDKRQRSRSPHGRGPPRRSNYDVDTYSSSRGYREREREDRYGGARRPGDREREWDRDRGSARRDTRRDDMDGRRRDNRRDLFEDRFDRRRPREDDRRDGGGDRDRDHARDRDDMRQLDRQQRQKSNSPPHKPREPTPDLTEVIPVLERRRRLNMWDVKPKGYENVTAGQAKLSGMFPLPGAPRQQPMDASRLQAFMSAPGNADASALKPVTSRQSRRLRVYNVPPSTTDRILVEFFNLQLNGLNITKGIDPCTSANVNSETSFAILEFKAAEDATHALALDGINMESGHVNNGHANGSSQGLRIMRPTDYIMNVFKDDSMTDAGVVSDVVPETTNKICIANIPPYLDEDQVKELLVAFGALRSFVLAKDMASGQSRGFAFCEYVDADTATDIAVEGLDNMELGDSRLTVKRSSVGIQQNFAEMNIDVLKTLVKNADPSKVRRTRVLCLYNIVTADDLLNPDDAEEIEEDVKEECEKFGEILALKIPRPSGARNNHGVGKVYVKYATVEEAKKAMENLSGRHFDSRTVVVSYFDEESFDVGVW